MTTVTCTNIEEPTKPVSLTRISCWLSVIYWYLFVFCCLIGSKIIVVVAIVWLVGQLLLLLIALYRSVKRSEGSIKQ
jgi:preprotein translocase subunit SecG